MTDTNQLPERLRKAITEIRRKPYPISDLIPLLSAAADALQDRAQVQGEAFGYIHHFAAHDESGALIDTTWEADGCADPLPHPTFPAMWKWSHCTPFYTTQRPTQATQAEVTDEQIKEAAVKAVKDGKLSWLGFEKDDQDKYTIPVISKSHYQFARAILALRPERVPMTNEQWDDVLGSAGPDMLDLAKQWADNKIHVYQVVNQAEKIVKAAVLRGITAQAKKEQA